MPEVKKLWSKKNSVIFCWPGEELLEISYDTNRIVVPDRMTVSRPGIGSKHTHPPAVLNGRHVPGTVLVEDVVSMTPEGGFRTTMSIDNLCRYLTKDREELFNMGFNIVDSPELIEEAFQLGIPLWEESQVKRAREIVSKEMQRQKSYRDRGEQPPVSMSEHLVAWAVRHLRNRPQQRAHSFDDLAAAMDGRAVEPPTPAAVPAPPQGYDPGQGMDRDGLASQIVQAAALFREASELGVPLNNFEMKALLSGSADTIEKVRIKVQAQRNKVGARAVVESAV